MKKLLKEERGVSLIALVITIIVVIILAAIAFGTSTRTITNANYSDYVNNVAEVQHAFDVAAMNVKGTEAMRGNSLTDEQVFNYVAKDGQSSADFLVRSEVPNYTVIVDGGQLGIKLPKMRVENANGQMVDMKYAITKAGTVFTWPPFDYQDKEEGSVKLCINDRDTVTSKEETEITVRGESFTIQLKDDKTLKSSAVFSSTVDVDSLKSGDVVTAKNGNTEEKFYVFSVNDNEVKLLTEKGIDANLKQNGGAVKFQNSYTEEKYNANEPAYWAEGVTRSYPYNLNQEVSSEEAEEKIPLWRAQEYGKQFAGVKESRLLTKEELDVLLIGRTNTNSNTSGDTTYQSIVQGIENTDGVRWLYQTTTGSAYSWWLGSASYTRNVWYVVSNGRVGDYLAYYSHAARPVLIISKSNIEKVSD